MGQKIWCGMFLMIEYRMGGMFLMIEYRIEQENGTDDLVWSVFNDRK